MTIPATTPQPDAPGFRKLSTMFTIEGVIFVILGILAVLLPVVATLAITIMIGWLLAIGGAVGLVTSFWVRQAPGYGWALVSAALGLAAGIILIARPITGELSLTFVVIAFFIMEGVVTIMYALDHRRELAGRWGFMLVSGIVTLVLAAMIVMGLPATAEWAIGLLVGIDMIFGGFALIAMGMAARQST
jgi:uncharacterized membrane protein HdeD (DUF308 family)